MPDEQKAAKQEVLPNSIGNAEGRLYILASMAKIKTGVLENGGNIHQGMLLPLSDTSYIYSLSQVFENINPAASSEIKSIHRRSDFTRA